MGTIGARQAAKIEKDLRDGMSPSKMIQTYYMYGMWIERDEFIDLVNDIRERMASDKQKEMIEESKRIEEKKYKTKEKQRLYRNRKYRQDTIRKRIEEIKQIDLRIVRWKYKHLNGVTFGAKNKPYYSSELEIFGALMEGKIIAPPLWG